MKITLYDALIGAAAGAGGVLVALLAWLGFGSALGVPLGLLSGAIAGGVVVWLRGIAIAQRVEANVVALGSSGIGQPSLDLAPTGWAELDGHLSALSETLDRLRHIEADFEDVDTVARSLWNSANGATNGSGDRGSIFDLLNAVRQTADRVVDDAHALDQATEQIASGAIDQTETVTRTTTTVESLSDKIDQISQNAEAATEAGQRSRHEARRGLEQVQGLIEGIDRLRAHVESNGRKVRRLGDRSVEIGTIVDLIDGISGRTDMLALNATIESVRAGEHGRGFAVVAEEIRKLAERTAAATREIGTLVEAIQADTHESIEALAEEQAEVEQEAQRVREAGAALERISQVAEHSARLVEGISRSATDQVHSTNDLVRAMQQISDVTQQTLAGSARAREHVRLLSERCERLHKLSAVPGPRPAAVKSNGAPHRWSTPLEHSA